MSSSSGRPLYQRTVEPGRSFTRRWITIVATATSAAELVADVVRSMRNARAAGARARVRRTGMPDDLQLSFIARSEALFASDLSAMTHPSRREVTAAITHALSHQGGLRGCASLLASEYGEHPETAAVRMRWTLAVVREAYPKCRPTAPPEMTTHTAAALTCGDPRHADREPTCDVRR